MRDFLAGMERLSRERLERARTLHPERMLRDRIAAIAPPLRPALGGFVLIAEIKRSSPSAGALDKAGGDITRRAADYARGGAAAISVLTEPSRFGSDLSDLTDVCASSAVPVMRKDFLVDAYQVLEARAAGASGVLLIAKILADQALAGALRTARELGMFALVECFDREDIARCAALIKPPADDAPPVLLGLNTRDLRDLSVDPCRLAELSAAFPPGFRRIAESGIETPGDARRAAALGYHGALVGTALMRSTEPARLCREMIRAAEAPAQGMSP
jgi:indole-3-glycerol phosphate synthase